MISILAINCTDTPVIPGGGVIIDPDDPDFESFPPSYKKGVFDWDMENKTFSRVIKYSCTEPGWGYPSTGKCTLEFRIEDGSE